MTEEFKAILDLIRASGEGAYQLAIAYFIAKVMPYFLGWVGGISLALITYKVIMYPVREYWKRQK